MLVVILLSLVELVCYLDTFWQHINKVKPPTFTLLPVEMVYTGDGYTLLVGGRAVNS